MKKGPESKLARRHGRWRLVGLPTWAWRGLAIAAFLTLAWPPSNHSGRNGALRLAFDDPSARARELALSPDGTTIAMVYTHKQDRVVLERIESDGTTTVRRFDVPGLAITCRFSTSGRLLVAVQGDALTVLAFGPASETGEVVCTIDVPQNWNDPPVFSPDGRFLAAALNGERTIVIWDLVRAEKLVTLHGRWPVRGLQFSPDGRSLAAGSVREATVCLWDLTSRGLRTFTAGKQGFLSSPNFSPDGALLTAVNIAEEKMKIWDRKSGRPLQFWGAGKSEQRVGSVQFSPDGSLLVTACRNGSITLYELATRARLADLVVGTGTPKLAFSADGRSFAATCPTSNDVRVWRVSDVVNNASRPWSQKKGDTHLDGNRALKAPWPLMARRDRDWFDRPPRRGGHRGRGPMFRATAGANAGWRCPFGACRADRPERLTAGPASDTVR